VKIILHIVLYSFLSIHAIAQADALDSIEGMSFKSYYESNNPSLKYTYIDSLQLHDYSGNWDFDGDGKTDSLTFIGNGGTHVYFHVRVVLSSNKRKYDYPFLEFDMPLAAKIDEWKKNKGTFPPNAAFIVADFDKDGRDEIYFQLNTRYSPIPERWKKRGLHAEYILADVEKGMVVLKNFNPVH
jgi:hypothetical protein